MIKWSVLFLALFGFASAPAFACGDDGDKDELRPTTMITTDSCSGDKDDDKDDY